jgi:hypothetical protein
MPTVDFSLFDTATLLRGLQSAPPVPSLLKERFFGNKPETTENVIGAPRVPQIIDDAVREVKMVRLGSRPVPLPADLNYWVVSAVLP